MKEVEIKAKLLDREKIIGALQSRGCTFQKSIRQEDVVYVKKVGSLEDFLSNDAFLRIRVKNDGTTLFTVKKQMSNRLDALEHEVEIDSKEEMEQALLLMGYKEAVRINKERVTTSYNDCEICLDDVEGLGSFIEMERLCQEGNAEEIQEELFTFFESIGISKDDRVYSGYDILTLEKKK